MSKDNLFEVIVVATMSAGKTTVINSLIGMELLRSANEATTATITRIHDKDNSPCFIGKAYSYQYSLLYEQYDIDAQTLKDWNENRQIKLIDLVGDIQALHNDKFELVLYDTPGPNNSQDDNHEKLTMEIIDDGNYGLILYILNATQLGVNDDRYLLEKIKESLAKDSHKEIIFLLNKADRLDPEKGETLSGIMNNANSYLTNLGFKNPIIIPVCAKNALAANKALNNQSLTRSQRSDLKMALDDQNNSFIHHAAINEKIKRNILRKMGSVKKKYASYRKKQQKRKMKNRSKPSKAQNLIINGTVSTNSQDLKKVIYQNGIGIASELLQMKTRERKNDLASIQAKPHKHSNSQKQKSSSLIDTTNKTLQRCKPSKPKQSIPEPSSNTKSTKETTMSNHIYIEHNPFTVETTFKINGSTPEGSFFETNQNRRLQLWVEELFPALHHILNSAIHFDVVFKGVEADFLDVKAAALEANKQGLNIKIDHLTTKDSIDRLEEMQNLMSEAQNHPLFKDKINNPESMIHRDFEAALNKDFDVYVAATMSAGKSTLINAMLGCDLLPAANEATTATIAQITDNDNMPLGEFVGSRINKNDEIIENGQIVTLDTLKEWNSKADTKLIKLEGNIIGIKEREHVRLVLTDTPGPNNSQDPEHSRVTMSYIQDSVRNPLILYVLNATQLGVEDDQRVLSKISELMQQGGKQSKDRFIFVVNKMDTFDPEAGESVEKALERVRIYLQKNGIENPQIYPVSANLTRLLRKRENNPDSLTRKESGDLSGMEVSFNAEPSMDFVQYMTLSSSARKNLNDKKLSAVLQKSGVPAIESMIDEYIDKYNLPNRVNRAYQALQKAIEMSSNQPKIVESLGEHESQLNEVQRQLSDLTANKDAGAKAKAKMDKVIQDKKSLQSPEAIKSFQNIEMQIRKQIFQFQDEFVGSGETMTKSQAERRIRNLTNTITFESNRLINELDNVIEASQQHTKQVLHKVFEEQVKNIFTDIKGVPPSILEGLQDEVKYIATMTNLGLESDEVDVKITKERVKVGTKQESYREKTGTRSTSKWYNPFSWGSREDVYETKYREVDVYETQERREESVDADKLWDNREFEITEHFNNLTKQARHKIEADTEQFARRFTEFMEGEFNVKFDEIINELNAKIQDKATLEEQIAEAKNQLAKIHEFKSKLNNLLAL
ncbi:dynamin family protein [Moraxella sp. Tifton1]|uniref:dynamin family protein n=1 Tax=Moraxella oculi TaxID=2940516 RepID=UPI00201191DE|nr:dynamin family protein [Moraxella sp. Tifton1]MCL1623434.1 dynamin family protein [Moraxella sp. Tifton1]